MSNQFRKSNELLTRARKVIPSATQTFSKGPNQWARGVSPSYLVRGDGAWVWDADGNKYLDYLMALGPIILGYNNIRVNEAAKRQIDDGIIFSQMHPLEVEVAEALIDIIPCAEMVRFGKNGSDVTSGAIRAARAVTGRDRIAICGYHGWQDWYIGTTTRHLGVPQTVRDLSSTFDYNDISSLRALFTQHPGEYAAVVMEPVGVIEPQDGFLKDVEALTHTNGALLIFDEIVTGFRMALGGAQEYYNVTPDIACFGKAIANGFPLSAVVGRREFMEVFDDIFFSGTFGGEAASLAACKATITEMQEKNVIQSLWRHGDMLLEGLKQQIRAHGLTEVVKPMGCGVRSVLTFPHSDPGEMLLRRTYFMQECAKRNLLYFCSHIPCHAHGDEELAFALDVLDEVMGQFTRAHEAQNFDKQLEGACIEPIFRQA